MNQETTLGQVVSALRSDAEVKQESGAGQIVELSLEQLDDGPYQPRTRAVRRGDVGELLESIEAVGQITPILVSPGALPGRYEIHSGHRRVAALRYLGQDTVRAEVREIGERIARQMCLAANLGRSELTAYEKAMALEDYRERFGLSVTAAAKELGIEGRTARRLGKISTAPRGLKEVFRTSTISARAAEALVQIADKYSTKKAVKLAERASVGTVTLSVLEAELERPERKSGPSREALPLPATLESDNRSVRLKARWPKKGEDEGQREQLKKILAEFLREVGIERVEAAKAS